MVKTMLQLSLCALFLLTGWSCSNTHNITIKDGNTQDVLEGDEYCNTDADCDVMPADCCGCTAAGTQKSVVAAAKPELEAKRLKECNRVACAMMISNDASCKKVAKCVSSRCELN